MSLSENIKRMRIANNMTQEQLATKLGISSQAVSKWETSETYPDGILLVPLAQALNASLDELFENKQVTIEDISKKLAEAIKQSGYTQKQIAEQVGVTQQQISSYIKGKNLPALDTLSKLCAFLDLDSNEILCIERPKQY